MSISDLTWSTIEKKIARSAFDRAYYKEVESLILNIKKKANAINNDTDVWELHDYLSTQRNSVDEKYDYRYSQLILVFARLMCEKFLSANDLSGLSEDKINLIIKLSAEI